MRRLFGWTGAILGGSIGWWLGDLWALAAAVILSAVGSGVGLYWGRRFYDDWIDWR